MLLPASQLCVHLPVADASGHWDDVVPEKIRRWLWERCDLKTHRSFSLMCGHGRIAVYFDLRADASAFRLFLEELNVDP